MSRTAAGVYTLPSNSWNPAVDGTVIDETAWNTTASDIETAIDDSIADNLQATIDPTAIEVTADADTSILTLDNSNAITIPTGTAAIVAGLRINTPNLTATGTITASASLYIQDAATEGTNDYAIWVDAGATRLDGTASVGTATAGGQLHVDQNSASGALPVITLDQADVDEDFFKFIGTSDTNVDRALVDAVDFSTSGTLTGWLKINVQDDQSTNPIVDGDYYIPFYTAPTA